MISLKMSKENRSQPAPAVQDDEYGYGTQIHLEPSQVQALGLQNVDAGKRVSIEAIAVVRNVNITKTDGTTETRICLQLTDMSASPASEESETAKALYGGMPDSADQSQSGMGA